MASILSAGVLCMHHMICCAMQCPSMKYPYPPKAHTSLSENPVSASDFINDKKPLESTVSDD